MSGLHTMITPRLKIALLGSVLVCTALSGAQATTLEEAVRITLATNPDIGIVASNREAVDHELRQARGLYLPQVDLALGWGIESTDDRTTRATFSGSSDTLNRVESSIILQQRLFDGFEADSTVKREKARVESAARRVHENSEFIALDAIGAYYEVLRQRELVILAEENAAIHIEILGSLKEQLLGGGGSTADVSQAEARLSRSRSTVTSSLNELRNAEANYTRIVGQFPDDLSMPELSFDMLPSDLDTAVDQVNDGNPTTRIFEADVRSSEAEVDLTEVLFYPSIALELESEYNERRDGIDDWEFNNQAMVRLRWNLFRGGIDRAARQEALARLNESKNRRYQSFVDAQNETRQSWFALEANRQQVEDYTRSVSFNIETRDAYRQQFDVAQRTLLDVLDAENELFVSKGQLVTAEINEILASFRLLALGGTLLQTVGVPAPDQAVVQHESFPDAVGLP